MDSKEKEYMGEFNIIHLREKRVKISHQMNFYVFLCAFHAHRTEARIGIHLPSHCQLPHRRGERGNFYRNTFSPYSVCPDAAPTIDSTNETESKRKRSGNGQRKKGKEKKKAALSILFFCLSPFFRGS